MRITNQPFMAQQMRNTKAVKSHEKAQTDKVTDTSKMSQAEEREVCKRDLLDNKRTIEKAALAKAESVSVRESVIDTELKTAIVDEDFLAQLKAVREQQPKLEVNWDRVVDPDGRIAAKAYVESLVTQYQKAQNTIKEYYSDAHKDNLSQPSQLEALNHLSLKYTKLGLDMNSPYYRADMSEAERNMSYEQERALLLGGNVTLKDPYALASSGGLLNVEDADKIANQTVRNKLDELIKQWQQDNAGKFIKTQHC